MTAIWVITMTFSSDGEAVPGVAVAARHEPVMATEVIEAMKFDAGEDSAGCYIDCTYGRGGHSGAIASRLGRDDRLLVIDRDPDAVAHARTLFAGDDRVEVRRGDFACLASTFREAGQGEEIRAALFDLGASSDQLENPERGFSFRRDGPLDMRMDPDSGVSAADWLNTVNQDKLAELLHLAGEGRRARPLARAIVERRRSRPFRRTLDLAGLIEKTVGRRNRLHPATATFLVLRLCVNLELESLEKGLEEAYQLLAVGGRLLVIGFQSLEHRVVKRFFRLHALPKKNFADSGRGLRVMRPVFPGRDEIVANPRARSAVLRVAERLQ